VKELKINLSLPFLVSLEVEMGLSRFLIGIYGGLQSSVVAIAFFLSPKKYVVTRKPQQTHLSR
jgi:hypothetical protein